MLGNSVFYVIDYHSLLNFPWSYITFESRLTQITLTSDLTGIQAVIGCNCSSVQCTPKLQTVPSHTFQTLLDFRQSDSLIDVNYTVLSLS